MFFCVACDEQDIESIPPVTQQGDPLSINMVNRSGGASLPVGPTDYYGMYCIEHAYNEVAPWSSPPPTSFNTTMTNIEGHINSGGKLDFGSGGPYRYPINDSMSVFLYYPYSAATGLYSIAVDRTKTIENAKIIADKYPDYLAGKKTLSVIGGCPEDPNEATVTLKHLMARIRFQIENPGADAITLTQVNLIGITWKGTVNAHVYDANQGLFTPDASATPETLTLIEGFPVIGTTSGVSEPQHMQIDAIYNYSNEEAIAREEYKKDYKYYLLVPPLSESMLANVELEIKFNRYGTDYTVIVEMQQIKINEWQPGTSYCYTIAFNTYMIDYIDARIEPWKEDIYVGSINLQEDDN